MNGKLIAPCGMNCGICYGYLREKDKCPGCRSDAESAFKYCARCIIRNCDFFVETGGKYCHACPGFPCRRLRQLDKRYRSKYRMSMIDNLEFIRTHGIRKFVKKEKERWACRECGEIVSCHRKFCERCGAPAE